MASLKACFSFFASLIHRQAQSLPVTGRARQRSDNSCSPPPPAWRWGRLQTNRCIQELHFSQTRSGKKGQLSSCSCCLGYQSLYLWGPRCSPNWWFSCRPFTAQLGNIISVSREGSLSSRGGGGEGEEEEEGRRRRRTVGSLGL